MWINPFVVKCPNPIQAFTGSDTCSKVHRLNFISSRLLSIRLCTVDALSGDPTFLSEYARDRLACYVRLRTEISPLPG